MASDPPDVVPLDMAMPGIDGLEVCRRLRRFRDVPVIMLTARDEVTDKVTALNAGADDYVAKPFAFEELVARICAVLRRRGHAFGTSYTFADVIVDESSHEVRRAGGLLELTPREFDLLVLFVRHARQVMTRSQILDRVWGPRPPEPSVLDVHVGHLRQKLERHGHPRLIHTVRGVGYVLRT